jgi:hypothetical protein
MFTDSKIVIVDRFTGSFKFLTILCGMACRNVCFLANEASAQLTQLIFGRPSRSRIAAFRSPRVGFDKLLSIIIDNNGSNY